MLALVCMASEPLQGGVCESVYPGLFDTPVEALPMPRLLRVMRHQSRR